MIGARQVRQHDVEEALTRRWRRPSRAASICSSSSDCSAVSRISVAKGSHCQATIRMIENSGALVRKSTGCSPKRLGEHRRRARSPGSSTCSSRSAPQPSA